MEIWVSGCVPVLLCVVLLGGCSGAAGTSCSSSSGCSSGLSCAGPDDPPSCGIPPMQQCAQNSDCPAGEVCHAISDACSASGVGSQCGPPCGTCNTGFQCSAGACQPIPCDQGYTCPSRQRCDPSLAHAQIPVYDETQGCTNISCTADGDCPAGKSCVNSFCQDGPGTCRQQVVVP